MKNSEINSLQKPLEEQICILSRGVSEILPKGALEEKLKKASQENRPLVVKLGADPSAPDLHLGHSVVLRKLKDFENLGHRIVFLIGDFTGLIGDPTGRSKERPQLTREEVLENAKTYERQIFKILDPQKTEIQFNSTWNRRLSFEEVLRLSSCYTVAQMLEREDFQRRYREGTGISILEFLYPLVQAYDSVVLKADIELGGMDQKFNLMVVREIQRQYGQDPEVCILMPILEGLDGTRKMSKSFGNYIGLEEEPKEIFGKIMSIPDSLILRYFLLLTSKSEREIQRIEESIQKGKNPRDTKIELACEILREYASYSAEEMEKRVQDIKDEFEQVFSKKQVPNEIPLYFPSQNQLTAVQILREVQAVPSNSEARRLIQGGGFYINQKAYKDFNSKILLSSGMVLRAGKRKFFRIS